MAQLSLLLLFVLLLSFAFFVYRARPTSSVNRWFAAFTLSISAWVLGISGLQSGAHLDAWGALAFVGASFISASFLAFISVFPDRAKSPPPLAISIALMLAALFAILSSTTHLVVYQTILSPSGLLRKTGPLYPVFSLYLVVSWLAALGVMVAKWRTAHGLARAQLQYLGLGMFLSVSLAMSLNLLLPLLTGRSTYSWLGPYSALMLLALVSYAILRHRLLDLRFVIRRSLAYAVLISILALALTASAKLAIPIWREAPVGGSTDLLAITLVILLLLTPGPFRLLSIAVDTYLHRHRVDLQAALTSAAHRLTNLMEPADLLDQLCGTIDSALDVEWCAVRLNRSESPLIQYHRNHSSLDHDPYLALRHADDLLAVTHPRSLHVISPEIHFDRTADIKQALRSLRVEVVAPLGRRDSLGILALGPKHNGDAYFARDLSFLETLLDITTIAVENALRYRHKLRLLDYANQLIESLDSAVITVGTDAEIETINPAAASLLAIDASQLGAPLSTLPSEVAWALVFTLFASFRARQIEVTLATPPGPVPVLISTAPLVDDRGATTGALVVLTDLTAIKELERQRRRAEHLTTMARLYAGMAHEIRTPLTAISSFVSMLPDRFNDPEYRAAAIRLLPNEVNRIVRLANRLRFLAPNEDAELHPLDLAPLLADTVLLHSSLASQHGISISLHCPPQLPPILADRSQIIQLLANLLRNSLEAMTAGGELLIEARTESSSLDPTCVLLRISDTGPGIDAALRTDIFEPFFTTKASGTGLGLTLCQRIADFHRATLKLLPRQDRPGTVAELSFPVAHSPLSPESLALLQPHATTD